MANTYTQIHIHAVFSVANHGSLISKEWKEDIYKYIATILKDYDHKPIIINGTADHIHILFGFRPHQALSDIIQKVKANSSRIINEKNLSIGKFEWQSGYGAFSYAKSDLPLLIEYIKNQEAHHMKTTFLEEYINLLEKFNIEYDHRYVFKPVEEH